MSNSLRIRTTPDGSDQYVKLKLDQDFDFVKILSLNLTQEEVYRKFCSDYGVVVGRVNVNGGFGVPNAKVSIFIPLDSVDKNDPLISGLYPYEIVTDKNSDGIRYNVLGIEPESNNDCFTPVGTLPTKRQVLDNDVMNEIYCKYYKFTTTTNHAGDFMIFGVPVGTYTLHVDADISDIGIISQRPYDLINEGVSEKFFYGTTKFKGGTNLDKLLQIKSTNVGINVQPFWGDTDNCEIGITRADVDLNYTVQSYAIFMGSLFGDQHKHSVNYRCRPRPKFGELCQQVASEGTINMIRKTPDGNIEQFDINGGRLIDNHGAWSYLVPMNLDNAITDEYGNLSLTQDPNKGIPTRASVRFKISMDENGSEGRLRTRANYLVPNNPQTRDEIDYNFDDTAKDTSFKDLYWSKIYTVSNFIPRFQGDNDFSRVLTRAVTGIKNVDECAGDKTPFPYNRVNTIGSPIFSILCVIITIIASIVWLINLIVNAINAIIDVINDIGSILGFSVGYVDCVTLKCQSEDGEAKYAPNCGARGRGDANYYPGDGLHNPMQVAPDDFSGWDTCQSFELAKSLGLYQFDFYNDWVTGSLYNYLLKYKKRRKGREVFCEYDCGDYNTDENPEYSGVDGNHNGIPDNDCFNHILLDTCYPYSGSDQQTTHNDTDIIREGLIKKYKDEFYYAATTHQADYRLFATDIQCLGSIFDCDWQGYPKLQPYLIPTTYKIPPDVDETYKDTTTGTQRVLSWGMVTSQGFGKQGLFFNVNCNGLHVTGIQCSNIRHICEFGVDIDERHEDPFGPATDPDGIIGINDIDPYYGTDVRNAFYVMNSGTTSLGLYSEPANLNTAFNLTNCQDGYDFSNVTSSFGNCVGQTLNGSDYVKFRGFPTYSMSAYGQPKNSYYMYFGILPGKTAIEKMNASFFVTCEPQKLHNMLITTSVTGDSTNTSIGQISFTVEGGQGPYTYSVSGPNNYSVSGTLGVSPYTELLTTLSSGSYTINVIDALNDTATNTVIIVGLVPFSCGANVTQNVSTINGTNGKIQLDVFGGVGPFSYTMTDSVNTYTQTFSSRQTTISNLAISQNTGYALTVTDSSTPPNTCITTGLTVSGPNTLNVTTVITRPTCWNSIDGSIKINAHGGQPPYVYQTTGPNGYTSSSMTASNLKTGTYTVTVVDSNSTTFGPASYNLQAINPKVTITLGSGISNQCSATQYSIPFDISGYIPNTPVSVKYSIDGGAVVTTTLPINNNSCVLTIPKSSISSQIQIYVCNDSSCTCYSNTLTVSIAAMQLPASQLGGTLTATLGVNSGGIQYYNYLLLPSGGLGGYSVVSSIPQFLGVGLTSIQTAPQLGVSSALIKDSVGCTATINLT